MEIIRGLKNVSENQRGCVASIGNYDGVHLGHQAVIRQLIAKGDELNLPKLVVTFDPHPQEFFSADRSPTRLMSSCDKFRALHKYGVDRILCLRFNREFSNIEAEAFIQQYLVKGIGVSYLVVGDDFRFGRGRRGDFGMLQQAGLKYGFEVTHTQTCQVDGQRVSSSRVRDMLLNGNMEKVTELLGRPYHISAHVAHGDKRGRQLGFPTANLYLRRKKMPITGVFVVEVEGLESQNLPGVANVGVRPTVGGTIPCLEVHLFDFDQEIYGCRIGVNFLHKLREEKKFASIDFLRDQINLDVDTAKRFFKQNAKPIDKSPTSSVR